MQFLLLQEIDVSQVGGSALGVVVSEAQTTNIEVIFKHVSFCEYFVNACVSLD